jgi:hypothetical protein
MNVKELAHHIDARLLLGNGSGDPEVKRVHAADTMSDLIGHASADTLLVTSLNNNQLIRVAELMDVPGICLVGGAAPDPDLLSCAKAAGTAILLTTRSLDETCRLLEHCGGGMKVTRA